MDAGTVSAIEIFEREHPAGATSQQITSLLRRLDMRFTEATLRKYVQLGLLPRSRRVGAKGKHQGSWGVYPAWTARQVLQLKQMLASGMTIEVISGGLPGIAVDCMGIATDLGEVRERLAGLEKSGKADREVVRDIAVLVTEAAGSVERAAKMARKGRNTVEIAI